MRKILPFLWLAYSIVALGYSYAYLYESFDLTTAPNARSDLANALLLTGVLAIFGWSNLLSSLLDRFRFFESKTVRLLTAVFNIGTGMFYLVIFFGLSGIPALTIVRIAWGVIGLFVFSVAYGLWLLRRSLSTP
jgi:hypothetical protein